jgi:hypothetical protein
MAQEFLFCFSRIFVHSVVLCCGGFCCSRKLSINYNFETLDDVYDLDKNDYQIAKRGNTFQHFTKNEFYIHDFSIVRADAD